ncbi:DUF2478 domain-containing protein [Candidatus Bipolaricaulota bacterium]|nr:DUF2478 domain-containing protein [Candidatus Bipolaricaulota bacterium]
MIVTGPIGSGKTMTVSSLAQELLREGMEVAGVVSPRILVAGETVGYLVRDLRTGEERILCKRDPPGLPFRRYFFQPEALEFANRVLERAAREAEVVVVDEVGPLELSGGGFAPGLLACRKSKAFLILTVRSHLIPSVKRWLDLKNVVIFSLQGEGKA